MNALDLLNALQARPFQPFLIHLSDGATYEVKHPDMVRVGLTVCLVLPRNPQNPLLFERYHILGLSHISRLEPLPAAATETDGHEGAA